MRITLKVPRGELTAELVHDVLRLVVHNRTLPSETSIHAWTFYEKLLAYDWAMREHLSASDQPVRRRPRPSFTINSEAMP